MSGTILCSNAPTFSNNFLPTFHHGNVSSQPRPPLSLYYNLLPFLLRNPTTSLNQSCCAPNLQNPQPVNLTSIQGIAKQHSSLTIAFFPHHSMTKLWSIFYRIQIDILLHRPCTLLPLLTHLLHRPYCFLLKVWTVHQVKHTSGIEETLLPFPSRAIIIFISKCEVVRIDYDTHPRYTRT